MEQVRIFAHNDNLILIIPFIVYQTLRIIINSLFLGVCRKVRHFTNKNKPSRRSYSRIYSRTAFKSCCYMFLCLSATLREGAAVWAWIITTVWMNEHSSAVPCRRPGHATGSLTHSCIFLKILLLLLLTLSPPSFEAQVAALYCMSAVYLDRHDVYGMWVSHTSLGTVIQGP